MNPPSEGSCKVNEYPIWDAGSEEICVWNQEMTDILYIEGLSILETLQLEDQVLVHKNWKSGKKYTKACLSLLKGRDIAVGSSVTLVRYPEIWGIGSKTFTQINHRNNRPLGSLGR